MPQIHSHVSTPALRPQNLGAFLFRLALLVVAVEVQCFSMPCLVRPIPVVLVILVWKPSEMVCWRMMMQRSISEAERLYTCVQGRGRAGMDWVISHDTVECLLVCIIPFN